MRLTVMIRLPYRSSSLPIPVESSDLSPAARASAELETSTPKCLPVNCFVYGSTLIRCAGCAGGFWILLALRCGAAVWHMRAWSAYARG